MVMFEGRAGWSHSSWSHYFAGGAGGGLGTHTHTDDVQIIQNSSTTAS